LPSRNILEDPWEISDMSKRSLKVLAFAGLVVFGLGACGSSTQFTDIWKAPDAGQIHAKKLLAVFLTSEEGKRRVAEDEMVKHVSKNVQAVPSYTILNMDQVKDIEFSKQKVKGRGVRRRGDHATGRRRREDDLRAGNGRVLALWRRVWHVLGIQRLRVGCGLPAGLHRDDAVRHGRDEHLFDRSGQAVVVLAAATPPIRSRPRSWSAKWPPRRGTSSWPRT
jgi:hypothetical protein